MRTIVCTLFIVLLSAKARTQIYQPISFPEKVDKKYQMDPVAEEEKYRKKVAKKIPKKHLKQFTFSTTFSKAEMFKSGKIYLSWPTLEKYIAQVLDTILPGNLKSKKIHAYIGRSSEINAFCLYDGTMIVNAGLIAEVKNEAALAAIMGHELGHYIKNHGLNRYIKSVKTKKRKTEDQLELAIQNRGYSQNNELEADEVGYNIVKDAGYDLSQAGSNWELLIREGEYYKKRKGSDLVSADSVKIKTKKGTYTANSLEKLLSSHPEEKERKEKLNAYLKANPNIKKSITKIDEDFFKALQKQARLESVALLFSAHNYDECLERAFRFHLFEPNEMTYSYYVAESIRRLCLMDYTLRKKPFLTDKFVNDNFKEGQGILHDLKYVVPSEEEYKRIKNSELTNTSKIAFETYKEAFYYFNEKLIKKDFSEAFLMAALFENNKEKKTASIKKYLAHPKAQRKAYASSYLDNTLASSINTNQNEIVMIPQVNYYSHTRFNRYGIWGTTYYNYGKSEITGSELANEISGTFNNNLPNTTSIALPEATTQNFNTKEKYVEIITTSFLAQREENEGYNVQHYYKELEDEDYIGKLDIFRLNPEVWEFFRQNKINSITYARFSRHRSEADRLFRRPALYLGIPTLGFTWLFLPLKVANYKKLEMYSYNSQAEEALLFSKVKAYWITPKKAVKIFKRLRGERDEYIKTNYLQTGS